MAPDATGEPEAAGRCPLATHRVSPRSALLACPRPIVTATAVALAALASLAAALPVLALEVPYLAGRVNDLADTLSPAARERIEKTLVELEAKTGAQLVVLTIPSLEGEAIEAFSVRVAQTWKLGRKGVDDGVLFLIAKNDRQMRIEVGYGLEARLTDALTRQILDEQVRPRFRSGDFDGGVEAGVDAIAGLIGGQPLPKAAEGGGTKALNRTFGLARGSIFAVVVGGPSLVALLTPGFMGWFLYVFLLPFYAAFPTVLFPPYGGVVACIAWILLFPLLRLWLAPGTATFKARHPTLGGFIAVGGRSGSGGGWSSGGGGFSGGGGSFGGGGASSSW